MKILVFSLVIFLLFLQPSLNYLAQTTIDPGIQFTRLNINNISTLFGNNGLSDYYNYNNLQFFKYPKDKILGYTNSGLVFGGKVNEEIRVGGTFYHSALVPAGTKRIYRVRKDYKTGDLSSEINDNEGTEDDIRNKYQLDWLEWPADEGAPYEDINNNGTYEYDIDIPGIPGADQTIWFKANDSDSSLVMKWFKSIPLGVGIEFTYWTYKDIPSLSNAIFRKYRIINNSDYDINEMYCSIQSDFDVGIAANLVGCDTLMQMAIIYNGKDSIYNYDRTPPALGLIYLGGIDNEGQKIKLSSFNPFINLYQEYAFPATTKYENAALRWYNLFQGKGRDSSKYFIPDEFGGGTTSFPFSGDPVEQTGWLDNFDMTLNNRGMNISVGPFNLRSGKSEEMFFALLLAGGTDNIDRLQAIDSLRKNAEYVHNFYKQVSDLITGIEDNNTISNNFILYQNYPNPFNPTTVISYLLPVASYVSLKLYDVLGREVVTIVDKYQQSGNYKILLSATNFHLSSGVYFYKLTTSNFSQTKKLVLLK